ncbi:ribonucleoside-diphosphate reductase, adenosylcobalamin-dependent, partial [Pseudomonas sp. FW305-130]
IDSSISKTINVPEDIPFEKFVGIYAEGYRLGCKGMTTYRPNLVTGSVLSVEVAQDLPEAQGVTLDESPLVPRAEALPGTTYKLKWPESAHAIYV